MLKQSFSWWCFENRGVDNETLLREARSIGYWAVELIQPALFPMAIDHGLVIATHNGHASIEEGLNDAGKHDRIEREILAMLPIAAEYKIPSLIVFSGSRRPGASEAEGIETTAAGLRRVAKAAEQASVTLLLELLNSKVDHPGYQADHTAWGVEVCKLVDSPRVQLLYDIYHMQIMEGDLIQTIRDNHPFFGHYHTAGNPGRIDIDPDLQEISYRPIFRAIQATGYDGYVGHEFTPLGDPVDALRAAYNLTNSDHTFRVPHLE